GVCIQKGREFKWWQSAIMFYITAGVTLSNGIKVFMSGFFVNLKDFFRPKYLLLAVILPTALLWGTAVWEYQTFVLPKEKARAALKVRQAKAEEEKVAKMADAERAQYEARKARRQVILNRQAAKTGKPMEDEGFLKWTDISTSRWETIYENLFGESLQFHKEYFLEDVLVRRPVFVPYQWRLCYAVEGCILLLFVAGIWFGRKSRFLWLCLSCLAFDMFLHIILGFGINEIYIMTPHWAFVLPIATAFLFANVRGWWLRGIVLLLTLYLLVYNGYLLTDFLLTPIRTTL
ncbi:MAG: GtrA family protein, partial [Prevotella sp.]|nr:GtrA family protein [Prevotella sp.]